MSSEQPPPAEQQFHPMRQMMLLLPSGRLQHRRPKLQSGIDSSRTARIETSRPGRLSSSTTTTRQNQNDRKCKKAAVSSSFRETPA